MEKILNESIKAVKIVEKYSAKTGNAYKTLVIEFSNDYVFITFLTPEQLFILNSLKGKDVA